MVTYFAALGADFPASGGSAAAHGAAASASRAAGSPSAGAASTPPPAQQVSAERLTRAAEAGKHAAQKVAGLLRVVPRTPPLSDEGAKVVFVVVRAKPPFTQAGIYYGGFDGVRGYVCSGRGLQPAAVFHGFSTVAEGLEYWGAATGGLPPPVLAALRD